MTSTQTRERTKPSVEMLSKGREQRPRTKTGGKKPGAGRPPGAANVRTQEIAKKLLNDGGKSPLEIMMGNARFWDIGAEMATRQFFEVMKTVTSADIMRKNSRYKRMMEVREEIRWYRANSQAASEGAAPYMHSRLSSHVVKGDKHNPIPVEIVLSLSPVDAASAYADMLQLTAKQD